MTLIYDNNAGDTNENVLKRTYTKTHNIDCSHSFPATNVVGQVYEMWEHLEFGLKCKPGGGGGCVIDDDVAFADVVPRFDASVQVI